MGIGLLIFWVVVIGYWIRTKNEVVYINELSRFVLIHMLVPVFFTILIFSLAHNLNLERQSVLVEEYPIQAFKDNMNQNSYVFSRQSGDTAKYFYVIDTEKGLKTKSVSISNSYIKEGDSEPKISVFELTVSSNFWHFVLPDFLLPYNKEYIFTVPKGSLITDFSVDLE